VITGREPATARNGDASKPAKARIAAKQAKVAKPTQSPPKAADAVPSPSKKDMALTVRIEINLPSEASAEAYDNIFKSIKANLLP